MEQQRGISAKTTNNNRIIIKKDKKQMVEGGKNVYLQLNNYKLKMQINIVVELLLGVEKKNLIKSN